jgi:GNAT superfamily N-acetyltransferase
MGSMPPAQIQIRPARRDDAAPVAALAEELAQSFPFSRAAFDRSFPEVLADSAVRLLVAADGGPAVVGYLLGFRHLTFFAGGPVGWVEEILVLPSCRGTGTGRALMDAFESWAAERGCSMVALATRRAAPFYQALGYEDSAVYFRKLLQPAQLPSSVIICSG